MFRAEEDYLKAIYSLTVEKNIDMIKSNELVNHFGFTDQTVNEMIKKMVSKKLLNFQPYKGISLTSKGKKEAVRMVRAHRIWEVFLVEKFGFDWSDVHDDAELLEHSSSDRVIEALAKYLDYPTHCQHGNPIPDQNGHIEKVSILSLAELSDNVKFKVVRVIDQKEFLRYLNQQSIKLNEDYMVIRNDKMGKIIEINGKQKHTLSHVTAEKLFVEIVK